MGAFLKIFFVIVLHAAASVFFVNGAVHLLVDVLHKSYLFSLFTIGASLPFMALLLWASLTWMLGKALDL